MGCCGRTMRAMAEIKDFSKKRKDISFRIDDDVFHAARAIPAEILMDFAGEFAELNASATVEKQLSAFRSMFEMVLQPESLKLFTERLRDRDNPIEIDQVEDIVTWLLEEYGLRPTEVSSSSADGPALPGSGTTSTVSTPGEVSISAASPLTVS